MILIMITIMNMMSMMMAIAPLLIVMFALCLFDLYTVYIVTILYYYCFVLLCNYIDFWYVLLSCLIIATLLFTSYGFMFDITASQLCFQKSGSPVDMVNLPLFVGFCTSQVVGNGISSINSGHPKEVVNRAAESHRKAGLGRRFWVGKVSRRRWYTSPSKSGLKS